MCLGLTGEISGHVARILLYCTSTLSTPQATISSSTLSVSLFRRLSFRLPSISASHGLSWFSAKIFRVSVPEHIPCSRIRIPSPPQPNGLGQNPRFSLPEQALPSLPLGSRSRHFNHFHAVDFLSCRAV